MKTIIFALAVGVAAFWGLHLLAPSPSWEDTGDGLTEFLDGVARAVIGKGDARVGPIVPAVPTVPAYMGPFQAGQEVEVTETGGCLNVRIYPGLDAPARSCLPEGTRLKIILGPLYAQGIWWWAAEREGWMAEPYLSPVVAGEDEPLIAQEVAAPRPQEGHSYNSAITRTTARLDGISRSSRTLCDCSQHLLPPADGPDHAIVCGGCGTARGSIYATGQGESSRASCQPPVRLLQLIASVSGTNI